ncbi:MAG TPA: SDR family NAD(P)-dependent oxidoreductase [Acidimicrobiales bacterium]
MIDFNDQVVIVTGAGRGLGRLYALELARRGAHVVVNDLGGSVDGEGADPNVADDVVEEIEREGGTAVASHESVDSSSGGVAIVQTALNTFGRVDALVSNAGIYNTSPFDEMPFEQFQRMLQVHLEGAFNVCQPAFRAMKAQGYGRIVLAASSIGAFGESVSAHYAAAKGGVIGLKNALAAEGEAYGILVNDVLPIGRTRMSGDYESSDDIPDEHRRIIEASKPEHAVAMVVYLASRNCEITHQTFSAGVGRYARAFTGLTPGWLSGLDGPVATADDIESHIEEITSTEGYWIPQSALQEMADIMSRHGMVP